MEGRQDCQCEEPQPDSDKDFFVEVVLRQKAHGVLLLDLPTRPVLIEVATSNPEISLEYF